MNLENLNKEFANKKEKEFLDKLFDDVRNENLYVLPVGKHELVIEKIEVRGDGKERIYKTKIRYTKSCKAVPYTTIEEIFKLSDDNKEKQRLKYFLLKAFKHKFTENGNIERMDEQVLFWKGKKFMWIVGRKEQLIFKNEDTFIVTCKNFLFFRENILSAYIPLSQANINLIERVKQARKKEIQNNLKSLEL